MMRLFEAEKEIPQESIITVRSFGMHISGNIILIEMSANVPLTGIIQELCRRRARTAAALCMSN